MIIDAARTPMGEAMDADCCVVGSGAAGVTLALKLARAGRQVVLVEAGGARLTDASQDFFRGEAVGDRNHPLDELRQRQLGGTTGSWGGRCIPFDPIDFEQRDYIDNSGWPIRYEEVARYYPEALDWCHAGPAVFDADEAGIPPLIPGFQDGDVKTTLLERWSLPTDFGKDYRHDLEHHPNLRVFVNAPCTHIHLNDSHDSVTHITVTALQNTHIRARNFILCAGGLETPRLLLTSRSQQPHGIGNGRDQVGRYYMGHLVGVVSELVLGPGHSNVHEHYSRHRGVYVRRRITIDEDTQRRRGLPNMGALLHYPLIANPSHGSALLSAMFFAKFSAAMKRRMPRSVLGPEVTGMSPARLVFAHLRNVATDMPSAMRYLPGFVWRRFFVKRRIPSLIPPNHSNRYPLFYHAEQTPNPDSRITLSSRRDQLGIPRLKVDFRVQSGDLDRIIAAQQTIGEWMDRTGVGKLRFLNDDYAEDISSQFAGGDGHFIGSTRMGEDPANSVVTPDCNVHGIGNLYIAGSSVFPTSGQANPTLTIVALALRLAEHLTSSR